MLSAKLTIFEGPDGAGKSTAAKAYAEATGARYVHFGPLPRVGKNLARIYVEAMLPALLGYQNVVLDRCWLSELPYGLAFREGKDRLDGSASRRMLERLAFRCGAVVVRCLPPWDMVKVNYLARKQLEMLDDESQLGIVYDAYLDEPTDLPDLTYDYTTGGLPVDQLEAMRSICHPLDIASAGVWDAPIILVGERFADMKDCDAFYQWPFASFNGEGCSRWLAEQLDLVDVGEDQLMWINADQDLSVLADLEPVKIIALGDAAHGKLVAVGFKPDHVPHPQSWRRFNCNERYPLLDLI